jgi:hypothetical protein
VRFWRRRNHDWEIDRILSRAAPEPPPELTRSLVREIEAGRYDRSLWALSRLSFAGAVTVLMLGSLASFGGLGYAATGAEQAAEAVERALTPEKKAVRVVRSSPAQTQYPRQEPKAVEREELNVAGKAVRKRPPLRAEVQPAGELPFTGLGLGFTLALGLMLAASGMALRRAAARAAARRR